MDTASLEGLSVASGPVYHYTNAAALLGIVEKRVLWASEANGLNDRAEVRQGWRKIREWLELQPASELIAQLKAYATNPEKAEHEIFILSASTQRDDANQWRLYADGGRGYAVELDSDAWMVATTDAKDAKTPNPGKTHIWMRGEVSAELTPWMHVLYEQEKVEEALQALVTHIQTKRADIDATSNRQLTRDERIEVDWGRQQLDDLAYEWLATIAHLIKEPGFAGEAEVRIVGTFVRTESHINYRAGSYGVVGFVKLAACPSNRGPIRVFHIDDIDSPLPITRVWVGPLLHPEHEPTVVGLLRRSGLAHVPVESSQIPLR